MKNLKNPPKIRHSKPTISSEDIMAVKNQVAGGMHATGAKTKEFEEKICEFIGAKHGKAVNSGTNAIYLALLSLDIKEGDEVIIPSYVCQSLLNAVNYTGAMPVLVDIQENFLDGCNISAKTIKPAITKRTKAIIVPHMFGVSAEIKEIINLGIPVIEDCAQSFGAKSKYEGRKLGSMGTIGVFSFYATKLITTGQGGMVVTNSRKIKEKLDDLTKYDKREKYKMSYNLGLTDIQSSLGVTQLSKLNNFIETRQDIAKRYNEAFKELPVGLLSFPKGSVSFRYILKLKTGGQRKKLQNFLYSKDVISEQPVFNPLHRYLGLNSNNFKNTELAHETILSIPIYPSLKRNELKKIIETVKDFFYNEK